MLCCINMKLKKCNLHLHSGALHSPLLKQTNKQANQFFKACSKLNERFLALKHLVLVTDGWRILTIPQLLKCRESGVNPGPGELLQFQPK